MKKKITLKRETLLALTELKVKVAGAAFSEPPQDLCPAQQSESTCT